MVKTKKQSSGNQEKSKSLESWNWDAACSISGAKGTTIIKNFILPLIFTKRLGLGGVEADIVGKSYEYHIRKFADGIERAYGEFYTPQEVGTTMSIMLRPEPGIRVHEITQSKHI